MYEKYKFEIAVGCMAAVFVVVMVGLASQINSIGTAIAAWLLMCFLLVLTLAWVNS